MIKTSLQRARKVYSLQRKPFGKDDPYLRSISPKEIPEIVGMQATIADLRIYPGKSLGGFRVNEAFTTRFGLMHASDFRDRMFMLATWDPGRTAKDESYQMKRLSGRDFTQLSLVTARLQDDLLVYEAPGMPSLELRTNEVKAWGWESATRVNIVGDDVAAALIESHKITPWVRRYAELKGFKAQGITALFPADNHERLADGSEQSYADVHTIFSDGGQYLLSSEDSHAWDQRFILRKIPIDVKRPNVVIRGWKPNAEDLVGFAVIRPGARDEIGVGFGKPCVRCSVTMIDLETGERAKDGQPLAAYSKHRPKRPNDNRPTSDVNVHIGSEYWDRVIRIGDPIVAFSEKYL